MLVPPPPRPDVERAAAPAAPAAPALGRGGRFSRPGRRQRSVCRAPAGHSLGSPAARPPACGDLRPASWGGWGHRGPRQAHPQAGHVSLAWVPSLSCVGGGVTHLGDRWSQGSVTCCREPEGTGWVSPQSEGGPAPAPPSAGQGSRTLLPRAPSCGLPTARAARGPCLGSVGAPRRPGSRFSVRVPNA